MAGRGSMSKIYVLLVKNKPKSQKAHGDSISIYQISEGPVSENKESQSAYHISVARPVDYASTKFSEFFTQTRYICVDDPLIAT